MLGDFLVPRLWSSEILESLCLLETETLASFTCAVREKTFSVRKFCLFSFYFCCIYYDFFYSFVGYFHFFRVGSIEHSGLVARTVVLLMGFA